MQTARPYSYLSAKAAVQQSPLGGMGIFATQTFARHELVAFWSGHAITYAELESLPEDIRDYPVQVWFDTFLGPTRQEEIEPVDYMNHSCEPSCGVKGSVAVVTRRDIRPGEELTFDYGTTDTIGLELECRCGTSSCRGTVTSDDWKDEAFRLRNSGYLSLYVELLVSFVEGGELLGAPASGVPALLHAREA